MKGVFQITAGDLPRFDRRFFDSDFPISRIGDGELGGKATGLAHFHKFLAREFPHGEFPSVTVDIPRMVVLTTELFDLFLKRNSLYDVAYSDLSNDRIAHAFQKAEFPAEYVGDLMALVAGVQTPLAIRSSSLLEDALYQPFAGVYTTKMIPNQKLEAASRFERLVEAIKLVYASTFFREAKNYIHSTKERTENEKMAVVIQEVVGGRHGDRFYPEVSGVARSYNFYPTGEAKHEEGVVSLALGLGKTVVEGGAVWSYSPASPKAPPPFGTMNDLLKYTQLRFWAVHMGEPAVYDPIRETEYMVRPDLRQAEADDTLRYVASTYDPNSDRLSAGAYDEGARVLTFAPLLTLNQFPLNDVVATLMKLCEKALAKEVEIEFAMTFDAARKRARFGFLQVRPMVVSSKVIEIPEVAKDAPDLLLSTDKAMGNGSWDDLFDVVYVKPETFEAKNTPEIALQLHEMNRRMVAEERPYVLIGFGRMGSSDRWLGIPVSWAQINGAKVIVEATLPVMNVDMSQGSHFFHNLSSFQIIYFSVPHEGGKHPIAWEWLARQEVVSETEFVRHVRLKSPLRVLVDGRSGKGVILHG